MTRGARAVCVSAVIVFASAALAHGAELHLTLQRRAWSDGNMNNTFLAQVSVTPSFGDNFTTLDGPFAPNGEHGGIGSYFNDFAGLRNWLNGPWSMTLVTDDGGSPPPPERNYTFDVSIDNNLDGDLLMPQVSVSSPAHLALVQSALPTIEFNSPAQYSGPPGNHWINLYGPPGFTYIVEDMADNATSWTPSTPLTIAGDYRFHIIMWTHSVPEVTFSTPILVSGDNTIVDVFYFSADAQAIGERFFSVVPPIPEPATLALLGLGLPLLLKLRRRR